MIHTLTFPLFLFSVSAGFPSISEDDIEQSLDLNEFLVRQPEATFFVRVEGDSMKECGIHSGDILCVDRSLEAQNGDIIIGIINGEATVKRLIHREGKVFLSPENSRYPLIEVQDESFNYIWGVVTACIKKFK